MPATHKPEEKPKRADSRSPRGTGAHLPEAPQLVWPVATASPGSSARSRQPGSREGLTRAMAEARLRDQMSETAKRAAASNGADDRRGAGRRRIKELARKGRKVDTTLANYESEIRVHFEPHFGETSIAQLDPDDVEAFLDACFNAGLAAKTVRNLYTHLSGIFEFALHKRWTHTNPCREVEKPASATPRTRPSCASSSRASSRRCSLLRRRARAVTQPRRSSVAPGAIAPGAEQDVEAGR